MNVAQEISSRYFSRKNLRALAAKGIEVVDVQLPNPYASVPDFILTQGDAVFVRSFLGVLDLAAGRAILAAA